MAKKGTTLGEFAGWNTEEGRTQFDEAFAKALQLLHDRGTQEATNNPNELLVPEVNSCLPKPPG